MSDDTLNFFGGAQLSENEYNVLELTYKNGDPVGLRIFNANTINREYNPETSILTIYANGQEPLTGSILSIDFDKCDKPEKAITRDHSNIGSIQVNIETGETILRPHPQYRTYLSGEAILDAAPRITKITITNIYNPRSEMKFEDEFGETNPQIRGAELTLLAANEDDMRLAWFNDYESILKGARMESITIDKKTRTNLINNFSKPDGKRLNKFVGFVNKKQAIKKLLDEINLREM